MFSRLPSLGELISLTKYCILHKNKCAIEVYIHTREGEMKKIAPQNR